MSQRKITDQRNPPAAGEEGGGLWGKLLDLATRQRTIIVPEKAINFALERYCERVEEVERLSVTVEDGRFLVLARISKPTFLETTIPIEIVEFDVSARGQRIVLRQLKPAQLQSDRVRSRVALGLAKALVFSPFGADPFEYALKDRDWVRIDNGLYHINLSATSLSRVLESRRGLKAVASLFRVSNARCRPGAVELTLGTLLARGQ
ncbi:MAG: hypothetical protein R3310_00070 [Candidatus Competibacteraceae bacterium]|nr:hypothetical protein [Candidatus Competibacteraceae bacterium]